jgi:hypothetical protein
MSSAAVRLNHTTTLTGVLTPGVLRDGIRVYVMAPGSKVWVLKAVVRTAAPIGSGARWRYVLKASRRGTYKVRVRFLATRKRKASVSRTLTLRVR